MDRRFYLFVLLLVAGSLAINVALFMLVDLSDIAMIIPATSIPVLIFQMYSNSFAHFDTGHINSNVIGFCIIIISILCMERVTIPLVGGRVRSDIFYLFVLCAFTVLPLVISLNTIIYWGIFGISAARCGGFSGICLAFLGFFCYGICRWARCLDDRVRTFRRWKRNFLFSFALLSLFFGWPVFGWLMDATTIGVGSANVHLTGLVFGFGLYWLMDKNGDLSPWLPKVFETYNEKEWL